MAKSVFILWDEDRWVFSHREYVGGGEDRPVFKLEHVTKRCRYSSTVDGNMIERAEAYAEEMKADPGDRTNIRVEVLND